MLTQEATVDPEIEELFEKYGFFFVESNEVSALYQHESGTELQVSKEGIELQTTGGHSAQLPPEAFMTEIEEALVKAVYQGWLDYEPAGESDLERSALALSSLAGDLDHHVSAYSVAGGVVLLADRLAPTLYFVPAGIDLAPYAHRLGREGFDRVMSDFRAPSLQYG